MSFLKLQDEDPRGQFDQVELALESLKSDPNLLNEHAAAVQVITDYAWSSTQVAQAFNNLGFDNVNGQKVVHFRRKVREGRISL